ncbi:MAG TPA: hypothetical protein VFS04_07580 [Alphaproteobacteria bacterium]|nr:hypothetical protein [Alphaproteobacteria bacterium]
MKPRLKTELDFLAAVERGEVVTQATLSRRVGVAIGLINALVKRAMMKGYVKARSAPYKRYAYYLTPKGFAEKSRLVAEYLEVSLEFFREARRQYGELFVRARAQGVRRCVLAGGGELAEIAILAAREAEVELIAILDGETNRDRLHGLPVVRSLAEIDGWDALALTDQRRPQEIYAALLAETAGRLPGERILAPALLKIVSDDDFDLVEVAQA